MEHVLYLALEQTCFILSQFSFFSRLSECCFDCISQAAFIKPISRSTRPYRLVKSAQPQMLEKSQRHPRKRRRKTQTSLRSPSLRTHCFFETPRRPLRVRTPMLRLGKSPRLWRPCGTDWERNRSRYTSACDTICMNIDCRRYDCLASCEYI